MPVLPEANGDLTPTQAAADRRPRIGVLSPVTGGFFFGEILAGVVREAARVGARVALVQTLDAGVTGDTAVSGVARAHPMAWRHLDGFVVSAWAAPDDYLRRLRAHGKPLALACTTAADVDACPVVVDNAAGIRMALDHLTAHGHTRITFAGRIEQTDIRERYDAYRAHLLEVGLAPMPLVAVTSDIDRGGAEAAEAIAAQSPAQRCTAVLAATDRVAIGLIAGLQERGLRVPQDVAVVGFDDVAEGWYSTPQLTTVRQRFDEVGALAAAVLLAELAGGPHRSDRLSVPTTLVVRQSCGCDAATSEPSEAPAAAGRALVVDLEERLAAAARSGTASRTSPEVVAEVGTAITTAVEALLRDNPTPEHVEQFLHVALEQLESAPAAGAEADLRRYAVARIASTMTRHLAARDHARVKRLSVDMGDQHDVGMGMLGATGDDPADLAWLAGVGVRAGCLALWDGPPSDGRLVIAGVQAPDGLLDGVRGTATTVEEFPPPELLDLADAAQSLVAYLIPVRGATGDHGLLCLVAPTEPEYATDNASYDHWASFLGAALREKRLLAEVRHSEKRYAVATRAANDGLWEWDATRGIYMSDRCADLLGLTGSTGTTIDDALGRVHAEDRDTVRAALTRAIAERERPVEVEARLLQGDGARWARVRAIGIGARDGGDGIIGSISDVDDFKRMEAELRHAALYDAVTGLPNRRLFLDRLSVAIEQRTRRPGAAFAVLFLDLDGFKLINDSLGHLAGDDLLREVGHRLSEQVRRVDTAARFGGDEFAVLMTDPVPEDVLSIARRIQRRITDPVLLGDQEISISASVGITTSGVYADAEEVLRDADIAMYRAKETERGSACVFDPVMHERAVDRLRSRSTIAAALENRQFVVHYQPIVDLDGGGLTQFEALVRWAHPERGLLLPGEFLPAMEGNSTIVTLGRQVLEQVCAQIAAWRAAADVPVRVAVNLSHREFWSPELLGSVQFLLQRHHVPPGCLVLEITESVIMSDPTAALEIMGDLHAAGLQLHIDDFGTGQSSLNALRTLPVDALKIDGSFIRDLGDTQPTALVTAIVAMGAALGLEVVAECVETEEQADQLRAMGCTTAQGWLYSRAVPPDDAGTLLGRPLGTRHVPATGATAPGGSGRNR